MELLDQGSFTHQEKTYDFKWYQTGYESVDQISALELKAVVDSYQLENETFFYFYTKMIDKDAIDDQVRTMITVHIADNKYDFNFNFSDSKQAMFWPIIQKLKKDFEEIFN